jgi:hypothetical protein
MEYMEVSEDPQETQKILELVPVAKGGLKRY